jgi:hypothetical protein
VQTLLENKEFMSCELRVCESCILQILGVFVSDSVTGMSLQQQAERSFCSRSPSPRVASPGFREGSSSLTGGIESHVPRLNLSPNALRKSVAQAQERAKAMSLPSVTAHFDQDISPVQETMLCTLGNIEMHFSHSNAFELRARRERLLESLLHDEHDFNCAKNEFDNTL